MISSYKCLFLLLFILDGCTTLNKALIESSVRNTFQPIVLIPDYDVYNLRIDIIRQTEEERINDSTKQTKDVPYHPVGFYLGNGLFIDLNDNISLLVPRLFNIHDHGNFIIVWSDDRQIFKSSVTYEKSDAAFTTQYEGLFRTTTKTEIYHNDSMVLLNEGIFSRSKILTSDTTFIYQSGLYKKTIYKDDEGYFYKTLTGKESYKKINDEIYIKSRYIIRNNGDRIDIISRGLLTKEIPRYSIIKTGDRIFIYDPYYSGLEIRLSGNDMDVLRNTEKIYRYTLKSEPVQSEGE